MSEPDEPRRDDEIPGSAFGAFIKVLLIIVAFGIGLSLLLFGTCVLLARH